MPTRTAEAVWNGNITEGKGTIKTESGVLDKPYDWRSRSADGPLTNPEEVLGAAHAGASNPAGGQAPEPFRRCAASARLTTVAT